MQAEEQSEGENFGAAAEHGAGDFRGTQVLANEFVRDQREGYSRQKKKEWCRQCPEELRSFEEPSVTGIAAQPCVIAMRLEHEYAG